MVYAGGLQRKNPILYQFEIIGCHKSFYAPGDTIEVKIKAIQHDGSCKQGIEKTRIFMKGLKLIHQHGWVENKDGIWEKHISVLVNSKSQDLQITAYHESDLGKTVELFNLTRTER